MNDQYQHYSILYVTGEVLCKYAKVTGTVEACPTTRSRQRGAHVAGVLRSGEVRTDSRADCLSSFNKPLKTFLFISAFSL